MLLTWEFVCDVMVSVLFSGLSFFSDFSMPKRISARRFDSTLCMTKNDGIHALFMHFCCQHSLQLTYSWWNMLFYSNLPKSISIYSTIFLPNGLAILHYPFLYRRPIQENYLCHSRAQCMWYRA